MAIQLTIGTSKKVKCGDFGSVGADCSITVELEATTATTAEEIQLQIAHHYRTITDAIYRQLQALEARPLEPPAKTNGTATPKPNGKATTKTTTTPTPASQPPPATAPAPTAKPNGTTTAPAARERPVPPQPAAQRNALETELTRQFLPEPATDPDDEYDPLRNDDLGDEDDLDDTPRRGIELLGWARRQPGDAKQELAQIGLHKGFPRLIKDWSPGMVEQALKIYRRTSRD